MNLLSYQWIPGQGPLASALERMERNCPRPAEPMGEAWFMGAQREMYTYLKERRLDELDAQELERPLVEIATGNSCFGPLPEWKAWLEYLLPRIAVLSLQPHRRELQELLVTCLMTQYAPGFAEAPYRQFGTDVLQTLGACIMDESKWSEGKIVPGRVLHDWRPEERHGWGWWEASGDLSSSLFLCLKYLPEAAIDAWVASILRIEDPWWREQVMFWLTGAGRILQDGTQPKHIHMQAPIIDWSWSHTLGGNYTGDHSGTRPEVPLVPQENANAFCNAVRQQLTPAVLDAWRLSIIDLPLVSGETAYLVDLPDRAFRFESPA